MQGPSCAEFGGGGTKIFPFYLTYLSPSHSSYPVPHPSRHIKRLYEKMFCGPKFYNVATDCLEASAEIVRFNRVTSAKTKQLVSEASKARGASAAATAAAAAALVTGAEPMVERVVFSTDGKVSLRCRATPRVCLELIENVQRSRQEPPMWRDRGGSRPSLIISTHVVLLCLVHSMASTGWMMA